MKDFEKKPVSLKEILAKEFPELYWAVDRLVPEGALTILSGHPASYKTWVLLDIARCVASGSPLFGEFATKKTAVLMIDEENGARLLQLRLKKLGVDETLPIYFYTNEQFSLTDASVSGLLEKCKELGAGMVIIDSLVRIHGGDENKSGDMAQVFKLLRQISEAGITVVITHHNRKQSAGFSNAPSEMRGSGDILASIDGHLSLSRKEHVLQFRQTKQRYAEELAPFQVQLSDGATLEFTYMGSDGDDDAMLEVDITEVLNAYPKVNQATLMKLLDEANRHINEHKLRRLLKKLVHSKALREERGAGKSLLYSLAPAEDETE